MTETPSSTDHGNTDHGPRLPTPRPSPRPRRLGFRRHRRRHHDRHRHLPQARRNGARRPHSSRVVFAAWIVGAILSLFGALSFAELGAAIPEAGGEYAYLRRAFGPAWGFLFGWMHSIVGRPSSLSSIAAGLMRFLSFLIPVVAAPIFTLHIAIPGLTAWIKPYDFVFTWAQPLAVLWIVGMTAINYLGVRLGGAVQVFLTAIKITSVAIVIGVAFFSHAAPHSAPDPMWPSALNGSVLSAFLAALAAALWAYDGWEDLNLVGSEVENPQSNFPRALVGGVALVALIYFLFSAACLKVLPFSAVAASPAHRLRRRPTRRRPHRRRVDHGRHGHQRPRLDELLRPQRRTPQRTPWPATASSSKSPTAFTPNTARQPAP